MWTVFRQLSFCLVLLWLPASWAADSGWLHTADNDHASVRLRAQSGQGGDTRLLLDVQLEKGWKTYWRSPGEGGVAPSLTLTSPATATWHWPTPERFDVAGLTTQGYHGNVTFPLTIRHAQDKLTGVLTLPTCSNVCILTDYPFALDLTDNAQRDFDYDFTRAMGTLPREDGLASSPDAHYGNGRLTITATRGAGWREPALYLDALEDVDFGKPSFAIRDNTLTATVAVTDGWGDAPPDITGKTLTLVLADSGQAQENQVAIEAAHQAPASGLSFWWVLPMALLGGLILNVMPCVLPVLAMKLGSVLQVEAASRHAVRRQFLASVAGILASFAALALMMTALRLSNQALGWGIQFQNPWFIGGMALVMSVFAASLLGLFEFRLTSGLSTFLATRGGNGSAGHFWQGAFATLLATPCTAPFLGTAISVALASPLPVLWGLFLAMGAGMSLPWLLIAAWPALALRLPRPGRWMNVIRKVLGVMMLGSALWLLSLLSAHWGTGTRIQSAGDRVNWQPLSEQAITQALAQHKRVFVDVTANWCVTCKANKYNVLLRDDVQKALSEPDVVALRGDWSLPSDTITQFLNRRQRAAVPFNQIYGPGLPQGQILPELLTRDAVLHTLSSAKGNP